MRRRIPLGGDSEDLDSRKSRSDIINMYFRAGNQGNYRDLVRAQALQEFTEVGAGPIRGMFEVQEQLYVVSGADLFLLEATDSDPYFTSTNLGSVDETGRTGIVKLNANGADENQIIVITPKGGYIYNTFTEVLTEITDADFTSDGGADFSVASLDQRFWLNKPDSNKFFGSNVADGLIYDATDFASAEQSPDFLKYVAATRTNLWLFGARTTEYWQTSTGSFPLRRVAGGTIERGMAAQASLVQYEDRIYWLADDLTVRQIIGAQEGPKISDLAFEQAVRGDGTLSQPGYQDPAEAEAYLIDLPSQKFYCITFPSDNVTWCYDIAVGTWHKRSTNGVRFIGRESAKFTERFTKPNFGLQLFDRRINLVGSADDGKLYKVIEGVENADILDPVTITTPPIAADEGMLTITRLELICEVGVGLSDNSDPKIIIEYSKNGGKTWTAKSDVSIGKIGEYEHKVESRLFGHTARNNEFVFRIKLTDPVYFKVYELWIDYEEGI